MPVGDLSQKTEETNRPNESFEGHVGTGPKQRDTNAEELNQ
jgi:hypothetical protein